MARFYGTPPPQSNEPFINPDGTLSTYGLRYLNAVRDWIDYPLWDDLRSSASTINPPGAASDPDRESSTGALLFAASGTELVYIAQKMSHGWVPGSSLYPHVHWTKTSSAVGDVSWRLRYDIAQGGGIFNGAWTTLSEVTETVAGTPDNDTDWEHLITTFGELDMTGYEDTSTMLLFELARIGGAVGDTYGADARLLEFDIHAQGRTRGTRHQFDAL